MNASRRELKNKNLFRRDTPLYVTMLLVLISGAVVYSFFPHPEERKTVTLVSESKDCVPEMNIIRSKDYRFAHRVLLAETKNENPGLATIKTQVYNLISQDKSSDIARDVSVYYRNLNDGAWFEINGGNQYTPASLLKVTYLITILKQAEKNPALLDKQVYFTKHFERNYKQNIKDFSLIEKKYYSIRELLYNMIAYSDNEALILLSSSINYEVYTKLFTDLGLKPPPENPTESNPYMISVTDYCKFFRILYNSSYLKDEYSEFALELLTKSTYKEGLLKNMEGNFPVAHKFGERVTSNTQELHEVGIFYIGQKPYLLGVMSTGGDLKKLSSLLSQISQVIYKASGSLN